MPDRQAARDKLRRERVKGYWKWRKRCERLGLDWNDREVRRAYAADPRAGRFRNEGLYWWLHQ